MKTKQVYISTKEDKLISLTEKTYPEMKTMEELYKERERTQSELAKCGIIIRPLIAKKTEQSLMELIADGNDAGADKWAEDAKAGKIMRII